MIYYVRAVLRDTPDNAPDTEIMAKATFLAIDRSCKEIVDYLYEILNREIVLDPKDNIKDFVDYEIFEVNDEGGFIAVDVDEEQSVWEQSPVSINLTPVQSCIKEPNENSY